MIGWIKVHRELQNHWVFENPEHLKAWLTIIMEVNHTDHKVAIGGKLFECKRGESLKSLDTWARLFGKSWNKSKVRRFFKLLETDSMLVTKNESKTTRLTVCNYCKYQSERNADETQVKRTRNGSETQVTPNNNDKKVKNENNDKKEAAKRVIDHLNEKTSKRFKKVETNLSLIVSRMAEGFSEDDCIVAINNQVVAWGNDEKMSAFLRPQTLFCKSKIDGYVNNEPKKTGGSRF